MNIIYTLLAWGCFAGALCRLRHTDRTTWLPARIAFAALGAATFTAGGMALLGVRSIWLDVAVLGSMCLVLLVSSRLWANGPPRQYDTAPSVLDEASPP